MDVSKQDMMDRNVFFYAALHNPFALQALILNWLSHLQGKSHFLRVRFRVAVLPRLERVLERSMMVCLLGLLRTERLANDMSAVTRVMDILEQRGGTLLDPGWERRRMS